MALENEIYVLLFNLYPVEHVNYHWRVFELLCFVYYSGILVANTSSSCFVFSPCCFPPQIQSPLRGGWESGLLLLEKLPKVREPFYSAAVLLHLKSFLEQLFFMFR